MISGTERIRFGLPDGHLPKGGLYNIFEKAEIPYLEDSGREYRSDLTLPTTNGSSKHVEATMGIYRPHDIPANLRDNLVDIGVSGLDFFIDRLGMNIMLNGYSEEQVNELFKKGLEERGLVQLLDLMARPSYVLPICPRERGDGVHDGIDYSKIDDLQDLSAYFKSLGIRTKIATELPHISRMCAGYNGLDLDPGFPEDGIKSISGKGETYVKLGQTHLTDDVVERGTTLKANDLKAVRPILLRSTPRLVVRRDYYDENKGLVNEIASRLAYGIRCVESDPDSEVRGLLQDKVNIRKLIEDGQK